MTWSSQPESRSDKAGGYAVQGWEHSLFKEIHGSYTNVMGLPLCEVVDVLREENTCRPRHRHGAAGIRIAVGGARSHVASLALSRLGKLAMRGDVLPVLPRRNRYAGLLEEILAKTDGVPLFVEESTRTITETQTSNSLTVRATLRIR